AGPAGVPVTARTEQRPRARYLFPRRQRLPPQRSRADAVTRGYCNLRELLDRLLLYDPWPAGQRAFVEHELRKTRDAARRREDSGVPRHAAQLPGARIVDHAGDRMSMPQVRRGDPSLEALRRSEQHVLIEAEWRVDGARDECVKGD